MSTERRFDQRQFKLEESTTQNGGQRTIFIENMTPGTSVPPHWHSHFSETLELLSGSMKVYSTNQADIDILEQSVQDMQVGAPVYIGPGMYHQYRAGDVPTQLRAIVEPGSASFEALLKILNGMARDGELAKVGDSLVLMAVIMDLSDAHVIGVSGVALDEVRREKGEEIRELKERLLATYDNEEQLKMLLGE